LGSKPGRYSNTGVFQLALFLSTNLSTTIDCSATSQNKKILFACENFWSEKPDLQR